jgi:tRNA threonylcarbamoyladenosine biosynthesis protein TsaE
VKKSYSLSEIDQIASEILAEYPEHNVFCFDGNLGAGKTTLIERMCASLGSKDDFSSPTFSIINEYECQGKSIYHMDWYRLNSIDEALNIGIEDYLFSSQYCFIEWYTKAEEILPKPYVLIKIESIDDQNRTIESIITHE